MANTRADSVRYSFSQMNPKTLIGLLTFQKKLHRMLQNRDYVVHVSFFTQWKPWHTPSHMARSMRHMIRSKRSTSFTLRHHMWEIVSRREDLMLPDFIMCLFRHGEDLLSTITSSFWLLSSILPLFVIIIAFTSTTCCCQPWKPQISHKPRPSFQLNRFTLSTFFRVRYWENFTILVILVNLKKYWEMIVHNKEKDVSDLTKQPATMKKRKP
jgi:hypothetical protein